MTEVCDLQTSADTLILSWWCSARHLYSLLAFRAFCLHFHLQQVKYLLRSIYVRWLRLPVKTFNAVLVVLSVWHVIAWKCVINNINKCSGALVLCACAGSLAFWLTRILWLKTKPGLFLCGGKGIKTVTAQSHNFNLSHCFISNLVFCHTES